MNSEEQVLNAVQQAQAILARYVEPGERDCEQTINDLLGILDHEAVVRAVQEMEEQGHAMGELRRALDRRERSEPPTNTAEPDLPLMPPEKRPQDPSMDGRDLSYEGYTIETREHAGEYPDTMPQVIQVTDPEGRKAAYVPLSRDQKVVDSSAVVRKLKDCEGQ